MIKSERTSQLKTGGHDHETGNENLRGKTDEKNP